MPEAAQRPRRQDRDQGRPQRLDPGQRNRTGQDRLDADAAAAPTATPKSRSKYEGTQFRVEPPISIYYFWMNTTEPPFNDLKVRQAVNYAVDTAALERIYAGSARRDPPDPAPGMPGYEEFDLYPHDMAKAKQLIKEANPSDRNITVWTDNEAPTTKPATYYQDVLERTRLQRQAEDRSTPTTTSRSSATSRRPISTPAGSTGSQDYPHPNDFFQPLLAGRKHRCRPTTRNFSQIDDPKLNAKIARLGEEQLGPEAGSRIRGAGQGIHGTGALGPLREPRPSRPSSPATIDLDNVIFNPTFGQDLTSFEFK